jgi:ribosomal protein S18 acetylase RimI-like enzyme
VKILKIWFGYSEGEQICSSRAENVFEIRFGFVNIRVTLVDQKNSNARQKVYRFLERIDHEFVPPLSGRGSSAATNLAASFDAAAHRLGEYVDEVMEQVVVFAKTGEKVVGIFTFKPAYFLAALDHYSPCNYITTVATHPDFRNRGVSRTMYHFALNQLSNKYCSPYWVTRTWSANEYHLKLLDQLGFDVVKVLKNDRGFAIDTLYLALRMTPP